MQDYTIFVFHCKVFIYQRVQARGKLSVNDPVMFYGHTQGAQFILQGGAPAGNQHHVGVNSEHS
jgi:hypothetical protein